MINFKKRLILLLILFCPVLSGCNNEHESSKSSSIEKDKFDEETVNVNFLHDNNAVFVDEYALAKDKKSHVFKISGDLITEHRSYQLVDFDPSNFDRLLGKDIFDVVSMVGCPSFYGISDESTIDYSNNDVTIRRVHFSNEGGDLLVSNVEEISKYKDNGSNYEPYYEGRYTVPQPSFDRAKKLKSGMCIDEVILTLGTKLDRTNGDFQNKSRYFLNLDNEKKLTLEFAATCIIEDTDFYKFDPDDYRTFEYLFLFSFSIEGTEYMDDGHFSNTIATPKNENDHRFDEGNNITVDYLKNNYAFFYKGYAFVSDSKNHVFKIDGDRIIEHNAYEMVDYQRNPFPLFKSCFGKKLLDSIQTIGIPTYALETDLENITYVMPNGYLITLKVEEIAGDLIIVSYVTYGSFLWALNIWGNRNRTEPISSNDLSLLKNGFCAADVCSILGGPKTTDYTKPGGKTTYVKWFYPMGNGKSAALTFRQKRIEKECSHAAIVNDFGYSREDLSCVYRYTYFIYFESYEII